MKWVLLGFGSNIKKSHQKYAHFRFTKGRKEGWCRLMSKNHFFQDIAINNVGEKPWRVV